MNARLVGLLSAAALLLAPASASAYFVHVVAAGETLTSIAATDGLSVSALAAANGLPADAELVAGSTLQIPPQGGGYVAPASSPSGVEASTTTEAAPVSSASSSSVGYVVQPGDTLSAIAARDGTTVAELASLNSLNPDGILYAGSTVALPAPGYATAETTSTTAAGQPEGAAAEGTTSEPPYPTDERVSGSEIADIADANGVPPSLAEAIGWQESGWNNDEDSVDGAVGVMQILPGTWNWINRSLTAGQTLAPASAQSNVTGGVLMLRSLLASTGGSPSLAAAGYYQGLASVEQNGMYEDTQQYVNDVMSLSAQFGG
jgi:LysM repeat protein